MPSSVGDPDPGELLGLAVEIAREAGGLLRARPTELSVTAKTSPTDAVTAMDTAAERLIVDRIRARRPDDAVLGEEGGVRAGSGPVRWVVDPLDGTVNYLYGIPAYAVSIAVEVSGRTEVGVVYDVVHDELYTATRGGGARLDGRQLRCSAVAELGMALVATGFAYAAERRAAQARVLGAVLPVVRDIRRCGSAALDLCAVARGRVDAYYECCLSAWDLAAGALIATEAGAAVRGGPGALVVAAAPGLIDSLAGVLAAAGADLSDQAGQ